MRSRASSAWRAPATSCRLRLAPPAPYTGSHRNLRRSRPKSSDLTCRHRGRVAASNCHTARVDRRTCALEPPPLRLIAGSDAIAQAEEKLAERQQQIDAHRDLSSSLAWCLDRVEQLPD